MGDECEKCQKVKCDCEICEECGGKSRIGDWPFCHGDPDKHQQVEPGWHQGFTPYVDIQLLPKTDPRCTATNEIGVRGVPINSRSERQAIMKEQGLQFGTQKFDNRGKTIYGGSAASKAMKGSQKKRRAG